MEQGEGGLDIKKLRQLQKGLTSKAGGGDGIFLYANQLPEEMDFRLLPAPAIGNGVYYVEQEGWWINGKYYIVNSTEFLGGGTDVIEEEIEAAKALKDKDITALLEKKNDKKAPLIKKEFRYLTAGLVLKAEYDDDDELISCKVVEPKVLVAKITLIKAINGIVTARPYQNQTKHGIADRVKGFNIILGKTGVGTDTSYSAMGWTAAMEMPEEYYDEKKIPNVFEITEKAAKSDKYLRSVIRNYLYGDAIEEDVKENSEPEAAAVKEEVAPKKSPRPSLANAPKHKEEEEAPKKAAPSRGRSLIDDAEAGLNDLD